MPKRRSSGPNPQNRRRRRRDSAPNLPREQYIAPDADSPVEGSRPAEAAPPGRPMRPTMRRGFVPGSTARIAPRPTVEVDYRYVMRDLRNIGILAAGGIAILVALSFALQ